VKLLLHLKSPDRAIEQRATLLRTGWNDALSWDAYGARSIDQAVHVGQHLSGVIRAALML
jgi:hypothetical protein